MKLAELFVQKQLVADVDTGIKVIMKSLKIRDKEDEEKEMKLDYSLFQRIFILSIFKESLVEVLREIEDGVHRQPPPTVPRRLVKQPSFVKQSTLRKDETYRSASLNSGEVHVVQEQVSNQSFRTERPDSSQRRLKQNIESEGDN